MGGWRAWARGALAALGAALVAATLLPLLQVDWWWVRVLDFPRPQICVALAVTLAAWIGLGPGGWPARGLALAMLAALGWQGAKIVPFTPLWHAGLSAAEADDRDRCFGVLTANVLMGNDEAGPLLAAIERHDPDMLLLLETDAAWLERVAELAERYPHATEHPQDNYYGLAFYTRLRVLEAEVRALVEPEVPSIRARLATRDGRPFTFYGVHPRPPTPGVDTDERDAELIMVAREMEAAGTPAVVAGDLNDVAWSRTTEMFRRIAGALDPREGRGLYASYHAQNPLMRWPLDHVFVSTHFELGSLEVLGDVGSDHFPILTRLCATDEAPVENIPPAPADAELEAEADEAVEEGRTPD